MLLAGLRICCCFAEVLEFNALPISLLRMSTFVSEVAFEPTWVEDVVQIGRTGSHPRLIYTTLRRVQEGWQIARECGVNSMSCLRKHKEEARRNIQSRCC